MDIGHLPHPVLMHLQTFFELWGYFILQAVQTGQPYISDHIMFEVRTLSYSLIYSFVLLLLFKYNLKIWQQWSPTATHCAFRFCSCYSGSIDSGMCAAHWRPTLRASLCCLCTGSGSRNTSSSDCHSFSWETLMPRLSKSLSCKYLYHLYK